MRYAHTVEQVRAAEQTLMAGLPDGTLMDRAAAGLAAVCLDLLGGAYGARIGVLAGSGDNGGDALFAAARLAGRGARVEVEAPGPRVHQAGLAAVRRAGGRRVSALGPADLVLDGIVGIGGRPGLRDADAFAVARVGSTDAVVVSVDVPSGVGVDSAEVDGPAVEADVTVTFGTHKVGLLVDPAASMAGVVQLVDIGLGPHLGGPRVEVLQDADTATLLPVPPAVAQKYSRGVVGVFAGSAEYPGAGLLACASAVRAGWAGMVRYAGASADLVHARLPEVVGDGRVQACVVGPGAGSSAGDQLENALRREVPVVVDADALHHVTPAIRADAVLTPHAGELAAMLDVPRPDVEAAPMRHLQTAVERFGCVVLLKGARTLVGAPGRPVTANATGVPWLATAGSGDVLAGLVGALLAAGLGSYDAARVGAFLHGRAGTIASAGGRHPISAEDLVGSLSAAAASCDSDAGR
jgi:hydroxyethylthiazole kinase-like uncharacterized protein yjeF